MSELRGGIGWRMAGEKISIFSCVDWEGINGALKFLRLCSFFLPDPCSHSSLPFFSSSHSLHTQSSWFVRLRRGRVHWRWGGLLSLESRLSPTQAQSSSNESEKEKKLTAGWIWAWGGVAWHFHISILPPLPRTQRHSTSHSLQQMKSYNNM